MSNIPWRTGVNMREFAFYGSGVGATNAGLQRQQLENLRGMGVKLVRFYASHHQLSTQDCIQRVGHVLNLLQEYGMQGIVCLDDGVGSGFYVPGTQHLHTQSHGHLHYNTWLGTEHRDRYMAHVRAMAQAFGNHPALMIWELGNEYALQPHHESNASHTQAFLGFVTDASRLLSQLSSSRVLVSTGLINIRHVSSPQNNPDDTALRLYRMPSIDAISVHYYEWDGEKAHSHRDINIAKQLGKPFYIGEFGAFAWNDDGSFRHRADFYRRELQEQRASGAFTALPWAYDSSGVDVGVSDDFSFSRRFGHDYEAIRGIMVDFATAVPIPVTPPVEQPIAPTEIGTGTEYVIRPDFNFVNVRQAPSVSSVDIGDIYDGDVITVFDATRTQNGGYTWVRIHAPNRVDANEGFGWLASDVVSMEPNTAQIQMLATSTKLASPILPAGILRQTSWHNSRHNGVDLAASLGTEVYASADGAVVRSFFCDKCGVQGLSSRDLDLPESEVFNDRGWGWGYGHHLIIRHSFNELPTTVQQYLKANGREGHYLYVMYAHLLERKVTKSQFVEEGTLIGTVGNSGNSTGPHLHLEARTSENKSFNYFSSMALVDPYYVFEGLSIEPSTEAVAGIAV